MNALALIFQNLGLVIGVVCALIGLGLIPFLAMMGGGPALLAEPLANTLFKGALGGRDGTVLHQNETDEYELRGANDNEPRNYWSRLGGLRFGLSYTRSAEAFSNRAKREDPKALADGGLPGNREDMNLERGGRKTFLNTDKDDEEGLFVNIGEKLVELKDTDGLDVVNNAQDVTMKTEGGGQTMEPMAKAILWLGAMACGTIFTILVMFA